MTERAKRITSTDVARAAGVSQTTVSFVLNNRPGQSIPEETRRRVVEAARNLGYRPHASARALASGRSDIVLLSIPEVPVGAGINRFIEELATELGRHGLTLVTHLEAAHGRPLPDVCAAVGASVVIGFTSFDSDTVQALHRAGASVVLPSGVDNSGAMRPIGRMQAAHLIDRGHQHLGYAAPAHPGLNEMAAERLLGVTEACAEAGLAPPVAVSTSLEISSAVQAVTEWTARSVTGVCAFNDETAIAILAGMREHGLTAPTDLAVIGADDIPTAHLTAPPLTTVAFDLHGVSRQRAEAVAARLGDREPRPVTTVAKPRIVQRSTT